MLARTRRRPARGFARDDPSRLRQLVPQAGQWGLYEIPGARSGQPKVRAQTLAPASSTTRMCHWPLFRTCWWTLEDRAESPIASA